ncbi:SPP1 family phage portal protein [Cytobacillus horneckiae]|uniref:phage portal protein n=1 Tax=Cytobacillus horneckiae TaxID=549687 RepID=UPI0019CFB415|nr:phage portal protein [Cytobacillus horneckiae]MBN6890072.1 phage portal protein [Cytobacillus horneckiae]
MSDSKKRFSDESNIQYTFTSTEDLIGNTKAIAKFVQHHMANQQPRLKVLQEYYKGNNASILNGQRRKEEHLADNRATHNFAKYVSQFIQGYMVGIPLKTVHKVEEVNNKIREMNRVNDADEHNSELILDQSIYGRAYELLYRDMEDQIRFTVSDVLNTFVIYDDTVEMLPIGGIRYMINQFNENEIVIHLYTNNQHFIYKGNQSLEDIAVNGTLPHHFDGVPIIEYSNNKFRQGDFEDVLTLIDLYDAAQSDLANYSQDLNDAMLKIVGNLEIDSDEAKHMRDTNLLFLRTEPNPHGSNTQADADYIYKEYDVSGSEAYKDRIANDIHMFTATPNMNDENFGGVQSGEAMKYKLFLLEQKRAAKERLFKKSLRDRYRLINNIMKVAAEGEFDVNDLIITFTENLPENIAKEMEWFTKAGGKLSDETMLSMLSFIENPQEELKKLEEEDKKNPLNQPMYDFQQHQQTEVIENE